MSLEPAFVVIDLETTGLNARYEVPLELALAIVDKDGRIIDKFETLIHDDTSHYKSTINNAKRHEIVGPMHEKSGLWSALEEREVTGYMSRIQTDEAAVGWLDSHDCPKLPLLGSSIGSLDRPFLLEHFPRINVRLHYRNVDISTVKELCRVHNPILYNKMQKEWEVNRKESHRAMDDVMDSLNEYLSYVENFLFITDGD